MHRDDHTASQGQRDQERRRPWVRPELKELPKLTDLTLQTGSPIPGGGNPGTGSTVF